MAKIVIRGMKPWDGEYDLETTRPFNAREWRWIKRISGYMPLTIREGFAGGDPDLFLALAVVALCRDGKIDREQGLELADELSEADMTDAAITLVADNAEVEADEVPLDLTPEPDGRLQTSSV
jgi:hypothetical protein